MGSSVLLERSAVKKSSRNRLHTNSVAEEVMDESEGLGSSCRVDSDDTSGNRKRKSISLNSGGLSNIPRRIFSVSIMSSGEKENLSRDLKAQLEKIRALMKSMPQTKSSSYVNPVRHVAVPMPANNVKAGLMKECEVLLKRLMSHKQGYLFNSPVDTVALNIPDYFDIIKHPMDYGTINSRLALGKYSSPWEFLADVRLTITNAKTYNPPTNIVHTIADQMSKTFEKGWREIETKLISLDMAVKIEPEPTEQHVQMKKRKNPSVSHDELRETVKPKMSHEAKRVEEYGDLIKSQAIKAKMSPEEKNHLAKRIMTYGDDIPAHIANFLKVCSGANEDEFEIDIECIGDEKLFELRNLVDKYEQDEQSRHQLKPQSCEMEIINESGPSNSSIHPSKGQDCAEEDVDIGGNELPVSSYPAVMIDKDPSSRGFKNDSLTNSRRGSHSVSSDSESGSDSETDSDSDSESENETGAEVTAPNKVSKVGEPLDGDLANRPDVNGSGGQLNLAQSSTSEPKSVNADANTQGENASQEMHISPDMHYRASILKGRFADTILKAHEKTLDQCHIYREREVVERKLKEEKARLLEEAKAAERALKQAEVDAAAEAKRKLESDREAQRQALLQMEKTVYVSESNVLLNDLEMLGNNSLEKLGLFRKVDDEEEDDVMPLDNGEEVEVV